MKPVNPSVSTPNQAIIDEFVAYKKSTKGLTQRGEQWLRDMTGRFLRQLRMNLTDVGPQQIVEFQAHHDLHFSTVNNRMAVVYTVTEMCKISSHAYDSPTRPGTNPHPRVRQCASLAHGPLSVSIWKAFQRHGQRTRRLVVESRYSRNHHNEIVPPNQLGSRNVDFERWLQR